MDFGASDVAFAADAGGSTLGDADAPNTRGSGIAHPQERKGSGCCGGSELEPTKLDSCPPSPKTITPAPLSEPKRRQSNHEIADNPASFKRLKTTTSDAGDHDAENTTQKRTPSLSLKVCLCHSSNNDDKANPVDATSKSNCRLAPGDRVYYRPIRVDKEQAFVGTFQKEISTNTSRITCTTTMHTDAATPNATTTVLNDVPTTRLVPIYDAMPNDNNDERTSVLLIVTPDTTRYRHLAVSQPTMRHVLEVGCSTGQTSKLLVQRPDVHSWMGWDTSTEMIETVQSHIPNNTTAITRTFSCRLDALVDPLQAANLTADHPPDTIFLDIGGNRAALACWNMLEFCCRTFSTSVRQIILKSEQVFESLVLEQQQLSTKWTDAPDAISWIATQRKAFETNPGALLLRTTTTTTPSLCTTGAFVFPKHALKAPLRLSPTDDRTPICRYHNYHPKGCRRWLQQQQEATSNNDTTQSCPLDHTHCHWCLGSDHVALECPSRVGIGG